jgi:hypothetical protein
MKHFEEQEKYKIERKKESDKYRAEDLKLFKAQEKLDKTSNKKIDKHNKKYGLSNPKIDRKYFQKEHKQWGEFI